MCKQNDKANGGDENREEQSWTPLTICLDSQYLSALVEDGTPEFSA
jgi:hypothetical protein